MVLELDALLCQSAQVFEGGNKHERYFPFLSVGGGECLSDADVLFFGVLIVVDVHGIVERHIEALLGAVMYVFLASLLKPSASLCSSSRTQSLLSLIVQAKAMSSESE